jgi:hypothetical protein
MLGDSCRSFNAPTMPPLVTRARGVANVFANGERRTIYDVDTFRWELPAHRVVPRDVLLQRLISNQTAQAVHEPHRQDQCRQPGIRVVRGDHVATWQDRGRSATRRTFS